MAWNGIFRGWFRRPDAPRASDVDQEIDEELMFHLRSLVDDELAEVYIRLRSLESCHGRFGSLRQQLCMSSGFRIAASFWQR